MAKKFKTQLVQFGFIGISNAAVDIITLNILLFIWPTEKSSLLLLFNTLAYILTIINSYFWNSKYTFSHHANTDSKEMMLFIIQATIALIISNVVFLGTLKLLSLQTLLPTFLNQNIAKGIAMFLSSSASFILMKYFVFKQRGKKRVQSK